MLHIDRSSPEYKTSLDAATDIVKNFGLEGFKIILKTFMAQQERVKNENKIYCKKGCANCCHGQVSILSEWEIELMIEGAKNNNIKINWDHIQEQIKYTDPYDYLKIPKEIRKCVFLNENNECTIYDNRPLKCRNLLVTNDTKGCDEELKIDMVVPITNGMLLISDLIDQIEQTNETNDTISKAIFKNKEKLNSLK